MCFFFSSRRRHTRSDRDWSSDVCSSDLRADTVVEVGQWSARGGIVDVFSPMHPSPARLEFDGDDIESIRLFDPTTQRSTATLDELLVLPLVAVPDAPDDTATRLLQYLPAGAPVIVDAPRLLAETSAAAP